MAWFGNDIGGHMAQSIIDGTDKLVRKPRKEYVYIVYDDIHILLARFSNVISKPSHFRVLLSLIGVAENKVAVLVFKVKAVREVAAYPLNFKLSIFGQGFKILNKVSNSIVVSHFRVLLSLSYIHIIPHNHTKVNM